MKINKLKIRSGSSINEWHNSIYNFNSNKLNAIIYYKDQILNILLNSYFNLKKNNSNNKEKTKFNLNKFNLFNNIFNIKKSFFYNLIENQLFNLKSKKRILRWKLRKITYINWINKKNNLTTKKSLKRLFVNFPYVKHTNNSIDILLFIFNKNKNLLIKKIYKLNFLLKKLKKQNKNYSFKDLKLTTIYANNNIMNIENLKNKIVMSIKLYNTYYILKRNFLANIYLNNFKFNQLNLINLKNIIFKLYIKRININITNMKYVYLENSILIDVLTRKLNDRKKRVLRVLKKTLKLIKLARFIDYIVKFNNNINNYMLNNVLDINKKEIYMRIIENLKNKHIIGVFLKAKGRLTRRMTASRAVYKLKYKGNMKDAYLNIYNKSTLKRGYLKSNVVYNANNSYNKNGSFGVSSKVNTS